MAINLSKNTQKAAFALVGSMLGFIVAKKYSPKETYPFILIGGFVGNLLGEELIEEPVSGDVSLERYENLYK